MGDAYREIMVKRPTVGWRKMAKTMFPICAVLFILLGLFFWPSLIVGVAFILLAVFLSPRFDVEYEYLYVDGELDIDVIYNKQKRKKVGSWDMEQLEILAPANSHALDFYKNNQSIKLNDYTSQQAPEKSYILVFSKENGQEMIEVELDDAVIADIRRLAPRKISMV